jgi:hypothetical protein
MEEFESQTEHVEEELHHHAHAAKEGWISGVALTAALLAALAATTALLAGHHVNEAMMDRIETSNQWNYYQAKGIKAAVLQTKIDSHEMHDKPVAPEDRAKLKDYAREQAEISADAREKEKSSREHFQHHVVLARGVTMFQVAIAVSAIAALTRRRPFWHVGMLLGVVGLYFLVTGLLPLHS